MEQPCYKCGQAIEEGVPFCPHCSAPQIRVVIPDPPQATAASTRMGIPVPPVDTAASPRMPVPLRFASAIRPCALAAFLAALSMFLGLAFPAATLGAGFLAVALYRWRTAGAVRAGLGAQLGAISGILCFGILSAFIALAAAVPDYRIKLREQVIDYMQKAAASRPADPQVQALIEQIKTPDGFAMILIIGSVLLFVFFIGLGTLGGALGGAVLGRRDSS
jgi:hypothetical protein